MSTQRNLVGKLAEDYLTPTSIKEFIDVSFIEVLLDAGKQPDQTQARASITGETFELCVIEIFETFYPEVTYERNVALPEACMTGAGGADFVLYNDAGDIVAVIEAKGSADRLEWPDGTVQEPSRPGLQRSDTMKKAVSQAYQVKNGVEGRPDFFILTSHPPVSGSAKDLCDLAEGDIIDGVVDVTNKDEVDAFISSVYSEK